ncbi:MAG: glycosyltransferase family 2 protein [Betaproteobacteria bacterium]|nr:glycosyltransferase family 2 protein [Betaproteobacteria bacterium]
MSLAQLSPVPVRAIIINCSTKAVTTLALLSALRHANLPVLLIDCESTDGSWSWFENLARHHSFERLQAPLKPHGKTLDWLFTHTRDEALLLIDSDLEIMNPAVVALAREAIQPEAVYGAGFLHTHEGVGAPIHALGGRFMDRMWIPFSLLKVAPIQQALAQGVTFMHSRTYLEFPWSTALSRLFYARHRLPGLGNISLECFAASRERKYGERSTFREYDTGAKLHENLLAAGYRLAHLGEDHWANSLRHYHGVTRATLKAGQANATAPDSITTQVLTRLSDHYGVTVT